MTPLILFCACSLALQSNSLCIHPALNIAHDTLCIVIAFLSDFVRPNHCHRQSLQTVYMVTWKIHSFAALPTLHSLHLQAWITVRQIAHLYHLLRHNVMESTSGKKNACKKKTRSAPQSPVHVSYNMQWLALSHDDPQLGFFAGKPFVRTPLYFIRLNKAGTVKPSDNTGTGKPSLTLTW